MLTNLGSSSYSCLELEPFFPLDDLFCQRALGLVSSLLFRLGEALEDLEALSLRFGEALDCLPLEGLSFDFPELDFDLDDFPLLRKGCGLGPSWIRTSTVASFSPTRLAMRSV